jgi:1-aminocyclopropane-1-carboxylate deaminase/D-cysteine desulfhydrase-like pyridoxal-dependent ACC family enzyme
MGHPISKLRQAIDAIPRTRLGHLPTPLEEVPRFAKQLVSEQPGGPAVFIKRDDCTGLAFGGNKTRHNEFLLADAIEQNADLLVWGAGVQSNNCRQTAAACAKLGLECHLLLSRAGHGDEVQGNLLLDYLMGASYEIVDEPVGPELDVRISETAERFRKQGRKVYNWDRNRVRARAALGYVLCMAEIAEQLAELNVEPAAVYICSAGSTGAGIVLGKAILGLEFPVNHILPIHWPWDEPSDMAELANQAAELIGFPQRLTASDFSVDGSFVGPGYGVATPECAEAIQLLARNEGILLDPSYTGKAMAGLVNHIRAGRYRPDQAVVFVHTGGTPALFAYRDELLELIAQKSAP